MRFLEGAPAFAVEVRIEGDYGLTDERQMAEKRRDYFEAGTLCSRDVDMQSDDVIKAYYAGDPGKAIIFGRGGVANADQAAPGRSMPVDSLFP
jgi:hypothetical protein